MVEYNDNEKYVLSTVTQITSHKAEWFCEIILREKTDKS